MGLREVLQARAATQGRTAEVPCGELGVLTVEALPLQEAEALFRGADADRAVFYAACRELQAEGDAMHRAGKLYAPDGIMRFVSDEEAAAAARVVLELSGLRGKETPENGEERLSEETGEAAAVETVAASGEALGEMPAESRLSGVPEAAAPQERLPGGEVQAPPALQEQAADHEKVLSTESGVIALAEEMLLAAGRTAIEAEPFAESNIRPDGLLKPTAGGYGAVETLRPEVSAAEVAAETVWITQEAREAEVPAEWQRESFPDRRQGPVLARDSEECFARQLLEGLRRAKWVRGE